jgi:hypothetical protein
MCKRQILDSSSCLAVRGAIIMNGESTFFFFLFLLLVYCDLWCYDFFFVARFVLCNSWFLKEVFFLRKRMLKVFICYLDTI